MAKAITTNKFWTFFFFFGYVQERLVLEFLVFASLLSA